MTNLRKYQISYQKCCHTSMKELKKSICTAILLLMIPCFAFAQTTKRDIKLDFTNTPITKIIESIEKQSGYSFFYNSDINTSQKTSIKMTSNDINQIVSTLLKSTSIDYRITEKRIVLFLKKTADEQKKAYTVTGVINDASGPVIGASIATKNGQGTITSIDGDFRLSNVYIGDVLTVSYVGFQTQNIVFNGQSKLNITLSESATELDQVVVTALGIKRSEKALSYNVQQLSSDDITTVKDPNFMNSLNGKVAGVTINSSASGAGSAARVVMRGVKSITKSNNALYVIDGIPMYNLSASGGSEEMQSQGSTEAIADINPDDIESMSVLSGAAAAALYGSNASNGAIVITTKKGKVGRVALTVSSNTEMLSPFVMPQFQNRYGTSGTDASWGKRLNEANYRGYDPASDYFQTGLIGTESVTLSTGTEHNQTYLSAAAVNSRGIIPNNKYDRYNFTFRNTTLFLEDKMKLDVGAQYIMQKDRNMVNQGIYANPLSSAYLFPRGNDWEDYKMYERYDLERNMYTQYWPQGGGSFRLQNPYWINYRNLRENDKDRYMLSAALIF